MYLVVYLFIMCSSSTSSASSISASFNVLIFPHGVRQVDEDVVIHLCIEWDFVLFCTNTDKTINHPYFKFVVTLLTFSVLQVLSLKYFQYLCDVMFFPSGVFRLPIHWYDDRLVIVKNYTFEEF